MGIGVGDGGHVGGDWLWLVLFGEDLQATVSLLDHNGSGGMRLLSWLIVFLIIVLLGALHVLLSILLVDVFHLFLESFDGVLDFFHLLELFIFFCVG